MAEGMQIVVFQQRLVHVDNIEALEMCFKYDTSGFIELRS